MHIYYVAGVPYSDDLYHSGVKGQKWGIRRYQNEDGTLTALGKIHYSAQKAGNAIKDSIKRRYDKRVENYKKSHPSAMSDEELKAALNRVNMEKQYLQVRDEIERNTSQNHRIRRMIADSLLDGGKILIKKLFESAGNHIVSEQNEKDALRTSKAMAKRAAKNKIDADALIDKAQRKQTRKDASSKIARRVQKDFETMTLDELQEAEKKWSTLKKLESRYRGAPLNFNKKD